MAYNNCMFLILFVCHVVLAVASSCRTTLVVDQSGKGHFKSIQSAIDHVPSGNRNWICIQVNAGIYKYIYYTYLFSLITLEKNNISKAKFVV